MTDRAGTGLTRSELLAVVLAAAVMVIVARGYHPTSPLATGAMRGCFGLVAAWGLWGLWRPGGTWPRWARYGGLLVIGAALSPMFVMSWMVLQMRLPDLAGPLLLMQGIGVVAAVGVAWRSPGWRRGLGRLGGAVAVVNALGYMAISAWIWSPPSAGVCAAVSGPGLVRLTPQAYPDALSVPYELLHVPAEQKVLASFKMTGNNVLGFWDDPAANRLVVIDVADPAGATVAELDLTGDMLPEHLDYNPGRREVIVNRVGYEASALDFVPLGDFPNLTLRHSRPLGYAPHGVVVMSDPRSVAVFSVDMQLEMVEAERGEPTRKARIPYGGPTIMLANVSRRAGSDRVYLSTFGQMLTELDLATGQRRRVELGFAGGDLTEVPAMKRVYQTDLMFQRLNVVDSRTMRLDRSVDLGFQPRAIAADYGRDLLMIGAWFTGEVHLYRLSTLAPLGVAAGLGPYLRKLSYDPERGRLYGASSCGVYQLDVTPHAGAHPESAP